MGTAGDHTQAGSIFWDGSGNLDRAFHLIIQAVDEELGFLCKVSSLLRTPSQHPSLLPKGSSVIFSFKLSIKIILRELKSV